MYSSLLPLASFPALAYAARREIPFCWRYSIMLVLTQLALTPVGVAFLLSRSPSEVAAAAAAVFVPFCMVKLVHSSLAYGMSRIGGGGRYKGAVEKCYAPHILSSRENPGEDR